MSVMELSPAHRGLLSDFRAGKRTALARVISLVENERPGFQAILHELHGDLGRAQRIGITGPPGAGKSTMTAALAAAYRGRGETVAVVAVDPTSPFTGGALLGDRIRMNEVATDEGVFIRSMASRGSLGGLAVTTNEVVDVLDAFGFDRILIETVGVGQSELDIAATADTTVVVLVPESGDSIQAMKAGLMEISDLFVVNKSDRPGADRLTREIELMLHLRTGKGLHRVPAHHGVDLRRAGARNGTESQSKDGVAGESRGPEGWEIPVLQTVAETGTGIPELQATLDRHAAWLRESGELVRRRRARAAARVKEVVERRIAEIVWVERGGEALLDESLPALEEGRETPYTIAARIVRGVAG
jgi:LAO/AO transport system kinase